VGFGTRVMARWLEELGYESDHSCTSRNFSKGRF
jgi:hypothetical protein